MSKSEIEFANEQINRMSDVISKKDLMEELLAIQDATYMSTCLTVDECKGKRWMIARAIDAVKDTPTVDAVEVVRCKDCKWADPCICVVCEEGKTVVCGKFHMHANKDGFCSYGERKEDTE